MILINTVATQAAAFFILHRAIPVTSAVGYARKKRYSLYRVYNTARRERMLQ